MIDDINPTWHDDENTDDLAELSGVDLSSEVEELTYEEQLKEMDFDCE